MRDRMTPGKQELLDMHGPWPKRLVPGLTVVGEIIGGESRKHWSFYQTLFANLVERGLILPNSTREKGKSASALHVNDVLTVIEAVVFLQEYGIDCSQPTRQRSAVLDQFTAVKLQQS